MSRVAGGYIFLGLLIINSLIVLLETNVAPNDTYCEAQPDGSLDCGMNLISFLLTIVSVPVLGISDAGVVINGFLFLIEGFLAILAIVLLIVG